MTVYLLAHGSVDPRHAADVEQIADRLGQDARPCYLDHCGPTLEQAADRPGVVVPLLLSPGYHVRTDVAEAVARARSTLTVAAPPLLTSAPAWASDLAAEVAEKWPGRQPVLLTAGTRDSAVLAMWDRTADALGVSVAHVGGPGARLADLAIEPTGSLVLPALVARGYFYDVIAAQAAAAGLPLADVAGASQALITELSRVIAQARAGVS